MEQFHSASEQDIAPVLHGEDQAALPCWQVLEADLRAIDTQMDEITMAIGLNPEYEPHFDRLLETENALNDSLGYRPSGRQVIDALDAPLPPDLQSGILRQLHLEESRDSVTSELEAFKAEKLAAMQQKINDYERRIDYNKIIEQAIIAKEADPDSSDRPFHPSISMRYRLRGDIGQVTYQGLLNLENLIDGDFTTLRNEGLTCDNSADVPTPETSKREMDHTANAESYVTEIERLQQAYRSPNNRNEPHWQKLRTITTLYNDYIRENELQDTDPADFTPAHHLMFRGIGDAIDDALKDIPAVDKSLDTQTEAYKDFCEQAKSIDTGTAIQNVEITGTTPETDTYMTDDNIRAMLGEDTVPLATSFIRKIAFEEIEQDENKSSAKLASHTWDEALNGSVIIVCPKQLQLDYDFAKKLYKDDPEAETNALMYTRLRLRNTLLHEASHTLHNVLPFAVLRTWDNMTKIDTTPVSRYVHHERATGTKNADMEDFADSITHYPRYPFNLFILSPPRQLAVEKLYQDLYPDFDTSPFNGRLTRLFNVQHDMAKSKGKNLLEYRTELLAEITRPFEES